MTFSKLQITDDIRRDSFEDRVCDDLSQVILQYLSIKDKFGFECVSKQFQRTVFLMEYDLVLDLFFNGFRYSVICQKIFKSEELEKLVNKLPNIKSFKNYCHLKDSDIDLIVKYLNKLTKININWSQISDTKRKAFVDKFGSKLI